MALKAICLFLLGLGLALPAIAQPVRNELIEIDLGRTEGFFRKEPVVMRAIVLTSELKPAPDTALLFFRGWPGSSQIREATDWTSRGNLNFLFAALDHVLEQDIAVVLMDCPTDEWGMRGPHPTGCDDAYRASDQYANEVRKVMARLRERHGIRQFFILGHSYGSISSRWLAIHLGHEIAGSIHSASMTGALRGQLSAYGSSVARMDMTQAAAPYTYMHNADDRCLETAYSTIRSLAGERLITMHGGTPSGDVCGGKHFHSYAGIEIEAASAMIRWMRAPSTGSPPHID